MGLSAERLPLLQPSTVVQGTPQASLARTSSQRFGYEDADASGERSVVRHPLLWLTYKYINRAEFLVWP